MATKAKVHSGASKRFKKTGAGYKFKHANKSHILTKMTTKRKRQLRGTSVVDGTDVSRVKRMLGHA
jgi:large subunit ribosomal protein L35